MTSPEARRKAAVLASSGLAVGVIAAQGTANLAVAETSGSDAAAPVRAAVNETVTAPAGDFTISQASMKVVAKPVVARETRAATTPARTQQAQVSTASYDVPPVSAASGSITAIAMNYLGTPYVYGGSTPSGFDCSGFVKYVYAQAGIAVNGRTDASIMAGGTKISLADAQPGDILWHSGHVGIYLGNGMYIHAPKPGDVVKVSPMRYGGFTTAVRY
ncbi:C40 family peptidase [Nanchangia anserum]|uniref:C40 family peptidase n=1 Tax=Nanchangia anserum TaxID=2692125 RepID=A0A8I0KUQ3_9ACTO|nr:C40 family peptidase [Nanchangia anserum]QOX82568.1 C40 family peptidase [Nanchangia anserum]